MVLENNRYIIATAVQRSLAPPLGRWYCRRVVRYRFRVREILSEFSSIAPSPARSINRLRPADVRCRACATRFGGAIARAGAVAGSIDPVAPPAADINILSGHRFENTAVVCCHRGRSSGTKSAFIAIIPLEFADEILVYMSALSITYNPERTVKRGRFPENGRTPPAKLNS